MQYFFSKLDYLLYYKRSYTSAYSSCLPFLLDVSRFSLSDMISSWLTAGLAAKISVGGTDRVAGVGFYGLDSLSVIQQIV